MFYELFASEEDLFVAAACGLVDDLVAALDARLPAPTRRQDHHDRPRRRTGVTKPRCSWRPRCAACTASRRTRGRRAMPWRRSVTHSPADCARAPTENTRAAAGQLVETCLGRGRACGVATTPEP